MTVFYVHRGNPFYLKYSLAQTRDRMPQARIVLLGDATNEGLVDGVEHHPAEAYGGPGQAFAGVYVHLSPNSPEFELFCFQRWFLVAEFVVRHGVQGPVVALDSDVLLFDNVFDDLADRSVPLATTRVLGPAFTYFADATVLGAFTEFIVSTYRDPSRLAVLRTMYDTGVSPFFLQGRYVSDMQLLGLFAQTVPGTVDLFEYGPEWTFDYAFHTAEGFAFNPYKRIKRVWWRSGVPYGRRAGGWVRFGGLHFQVGTKVFLPQYYRGRRRFPDRWKFRMIQLRGAFTTMLKFILDAGRKWRAEA